MKIPIVAWGAVSALGRGVHAFRPGEPHGGPRLAIARDEELASAGLARPFAARALVEAPPAVDRAEALLVEALEACIASLDEARPGWRAERVGLALGTSSGGMRTAEKVFAELAAGRSVDRETLARGQYFGPLHASLERLGLAFAPVTLVLAACSSSTFALGIGARWLDDDACDLVLAGGFDAVSVLVASGFESLRATTACPPPRPFRVGRDGMSLGEGAGLVALGRAETTSTAFGYLRGFGGASDAVHLTAPDRTGRGLARAASAAIGDAMDDENGGGAERGPGEASALRVDLVSAHATATPFNDAAEARALGLVLGARASEVPVHPFKAQIGHTLGAAGVLESLACIDALNRGLAPAAAPARSNRASEAEEHPLDPDARVRLLARAEPRVMRAGLKLSAAFGGANAALVLTGAARAVGGAEARARAPREAYVHAAMHVAVALPVTELASRLGLALERLQRADLQVLLALSALSSLQERLDALPEPIALRGAGLVVGTALGPWETNARFAARLRERGPRYVEPRRFPYTTPNAVAGECSLAFELTGPTLAVGGGLHAALEALLVARTFVRGGDAARVAVVAVEEVGDAYRAVSSREPLAPRLVSGAVATLVSASSQGASARLASARVSLVPAHGASPPPAPHETRAGHLALLPLAGAAPPPRLIAGHDGPFARGEAEVTLDPLTSTN